MKITKYGLSFGFTGPGLLVLVLLLVAQPRPIASQRAIISERPFPVDAGAIVRALPVHRTGPQLSTLDSNISAPQPPGRPLAAAALIDGSSGLTGERALTALKRHGSYESLEKAFIAARYAFRAEEQDSGCSGYRGSNDAHDFVASFSSAGPRLTPGSRTKSEWDVALRLTGYGYGDQLNSAGECEVAANGNRIEYRRGAVTEWYVSDPRGLEQGFTIQSPPVTSAQEQNGRLTLLMGVDGNLHPELSEDGKSLIFHGSDGECLLRYGGLYAFDARGRELPARLALRDCQVSIEVDDKGAVYPVVVDPVFTSEKKLTASDADAGDNFGDSIAISGDRVVVGAPGNKPAGSVYIFERDVGGVGNWGEVKKLTASGGGASDGFGFPVVISGDRVVVGANGNDDAGESSGSAYIFERDAGGVGNWGQVKKLAASDAGAFDRFGSSVAISGDRVVVGASGNDDAGESSGSAYIFERDAGGLGNWGEVKKLTASDASTLDLFGNVAISGNTVVVGAGGNDVAGFVNIGSAYIFERDAGGVGNWGEVKKLAPGDAGADNSFGFSISVAISGDRVVVAANDKPLGSPSGSVYIFERDAGGVGNWGEVKKLTGSNAAADSFFALAVAISGDRVVVAAPRDEDAGLESGAAYIFERDAGGVGNWGEAGKLTSSNQPDHFFGTSVAISGDTLVVGSPHLFLDEETGDTGSAYVFRRLASVDLTPPSCDFTVLGGPPIQVQITLQDTDSGLAGIQVLTAVNCVVSIPPFAAGTTTPVLATATKIDQSKSARVVVQAMDVSQNVIQCDPVITTLELITVEEQTQTFTDISSTDNSITVQNGAFGLTTVSIIVNGQNFALANLGNQEVRTIDVSSALVPGSENTISLTGYGEAGASALVIIADGHLQPAEAPALSISFSNGSATIRWTPKGTLESAAGVSGPWSRIAGATSPFTVPAAQTTFYRLHQ